MSEYPWREKSNTFTWLSSLYNPFNDTIVFMCSRQFNSKLRLTQTIQPMFLNSQ